MTAIAITALVQRRPRREAHVTAEPNVIPFIDVLLVLLIIFMVTAPQPTTDIKIDLPMKGVVERSLGLPTIISLRETTSGPQLFVGEERVSFETLSEAALSHALANNPDIDPENIYAQARLFVRADQATAYHNVVRIMETLEQARFAKLGVFAETAQET